jgi:hypothetical protein
MCWNTTFIRTPGFFKKNLSILSYMHPSMKDGNKMAIKSGAQLYRWQHEIFIEGDQAANIFLIFS